MLFAIAGFGPTRLLLPQGLRRHEALWILPVGAVATALELALLAYAFVPFDLALAIVLAGGVALGVWAWKRDPGLRARSAPADAASWRMIAVPLVLALLIGAIALLPMFRGGFVTVIGNGSDAHLAVGTAQFLQNNHPTGVDASEAVDRVPLVWRSKPAIYLAFGAVARLAGMEPYAVIATLSAALLAFAALGFWLLARELLGAGPWGAAAAMGLVGMNRIELFTGLHPYFNQTWGYMATAFAIVLAWYVVRHRTLGGVMLFAAFLGVLTFAYPLALPVPLLPAIVFAGFERRRRGLSLLRIPRLRSRRQLLWIVPLFLLLIVPLQGVLEKTVASLRVLTPGYSLVNWGGDLTHFFPERYFLGADDADGRDGRRRAARARAVPRVRARAARTSAGASARSSSSASSPRCSSARASTAGTSTSRRSRSSARSSSPRPRSGCRACAGRGSRPRAAARHRHHPQRRRARARPDVRPAAEEHPRAEDRRAAPAAQRVGAPGHPRGRAPAVGGQHALRPAAVLAAPAAEHELPARARSRARPTMCSSTTTGASRSTPSAPPVISLERYTALPPEAGSGPAGRPLLAQDGPDGEEALRGRQGRRLSTRRHFVGSYAGAMNYGA